MSDAEKILRDLIDKVAIENCFKDYDVKIIPITSGGANYTSKLFLITVTGDKDALNLFAKVAVIGEKIRESTSLKMFDTERFFYTTLMKIYRDIEDRHKIPLKHRINVPKYYGNNPNFLEETIVLEDLGHKGYKVYDRTKSLNWAYASKAIEEIAKLHALSIAFAIEYPEEFEDALKFLKFDFTINDDIQKVFFEKSVKSAIEAVKDEHKEKIMQFVTGIQPNTFQDYMKASKRSVLFHGDFKISNQMYKTNEDGSITIKTMDFQTMQGGSPVVDMIYLIFTGTDEEFRRQYYQKLVDHYYEQLCAALERLNLNPNDVYSREDYDQELNEKLPFGLMVAIFTLPLHTVEAEHAPVIDKSAEIASFAIDKVSDVYPERIRGVVSDYIRWGGI